MLLWFGFIELFLRFRLPGLDWLAPRKAPPVDSDAPSMPKLACA